MKARSGSGALAALATLIALAAAPGCATSNQARLEQEQRQLEESLKGTRSERDQLAANIEVSLLTQYDKIRIKKGGLAMARVDDESCDACHIQLPPQVVNEVIGGAVKICPSCNRLLYWMES